MIESTYTLMVSNGEKPVRFEQQTALEKNMHAFQAQMVLHKQHGRPVSGTELNSG